jgi:hypothetical protein
VIDAFGPRSRPNLSRIDKECKRMTAMVAPM